MQEPKVDQKDGKVVEANNGTPKTPENPHHGENQNAAAVLDESRKNPDRAIIKAAVQAWDTADNKERAAKQSWNSTDEEEAVVNRINAGMEFHPKMIQVGSTEQNAVDDSLDILYRAMAISGKSKADMLQMLHVDAVPEESFDSAIEKIRGVNPILIMRALREGGISDKDMAAMLVRKELPPVDPAKKFRTDLDERRFSDMEIELKAKKDTIIGQEKKILELDLKNKQMLHWYSDLTHRTQEAEKTRDFYREHSQNLVNLNKSMDETNGMLNDENNELLARNKEQRAMIERLDAEKRALEAQLAALKMQVLSSNRGTGAHQEHQEVVPPSSHATDVLKPDAA
jgi:hypothetical protein